MRALVGVAAGVVAGSVIPIEFDQVASVGTAVIISIGIGRGIAKSVPKDKRRKVATEGIVPFIFLLLTFMIIVFTALHQSIVIR